MDSYFKVLHAAEEVECLNIKIPHLITFMQDEEAYVLVKETELASTDPILTHQVWIYNIGTSPGIILPSWTKWLHLQGSVEAASLVFGRLIKSSL